MKTRFTHILPFLLTLLMCSSCVYDDMGECPGNGTVHPEWKEEYVNFELRINMNDGGVPSSRAGEDDGEEYGYGKLEGYEEPVDAYEKVRTLRVVIVRPDGTIAHNRMVTVSHLPADGMIQCGNIVNDNLQFKIVADETKKIYLFANEKAVNDNKKDNEKFDFTSRLSVGSTFPAEEVAGILIKRNPGEAFIDNNGDGAKTYVPMSECFDVKIPAFDDIESEIVMNPSGGAEKYITETLFITRSLIKFSFTVQLKVAGISSTQLALRGVTISNLANEGYYLPNSTIYDPVWNQPSDNYLGGREIVSFKVPYEDDDNADPAALLSDCTFLFSKPLAISSKQEESGSIMTYLPESKTIGDGQYVVKLLFEDNGDYYESKPLKIQYIPRNTHVKVNMVLTPSELEATVAIVPYISVVLPPIFGFDEVNPGVKKGGGEDE